MLSEKKLDREERTLSDPVHTEKKKNQLTVKVRILVTSERWISSADPRRKLEGCWKCSLIRWPARTSYGDKIVHILRITQSAVYNTKGMCT